MKKAIVIPFVLLSFFNLLAGCAVWNAQTPADESSVATINRRAQSALKHKDHETAANYFEAIMSRYPFGQDARFAHMGLLYARYQSRSWEDVHRAAQRFVKLYPNDPHIDYVYYMDAKATEEEATSFLQRVFRLDPSLREPTHLKNAFALYKQLVLRFPDSPYAYPSQQRMLVIRDMLSRYELHVANFYLKKGAEVAAFNRAKAIVAGFSQTPARDPALSIMEQMYRLWEQPEYAEEVALIRKINANSAIAVPRVTTVVVP